MTYDGVKQSLRVALCSESGTSTPLGGPEPSDGSRAKMFSLSSTDCDMIVGGKVSVKAR